MVGKPTGISRTLCYAWPFGEKQILGRLLERISQNQVKFSDLFFQQKLNGCLYI